MRIPSERNELSRFIQNLITDCSISMGQRANICKSLRDWKLTGSGIGANASLYNALYGHIDRLTSYLFSPADLRFHIGYEETLPDDDLQKAEVAGRYLTAAIRRQDIDLRFQTAVEMGLDYGAGFLKLGWGNKGLQARIVAPWNLGVYREDISDLDEQEAILEKSYITDHELWRRIGHLEDADVLWKKAVQHAKKGYKQDSGSNIITQIVMSGLNPVQPNSDASGVWTASPDAIPAYVSPEVASKLLVLYELTVLDDELGDYVTLQMVEPDVIITRYKRENLFLPHLHPYCLVQPNEVEGYQWGRPEIVDLINLQGWITERCEDLRRIMSLQYERIRLITGAQGDADQFNEQLNNSGWIVQQDATAKVQDLTPEMPPEAFEEIKMIQDLMDIVSGFQNILTGKGEKGVRSDNHAQTLLKTASPRLRDRALLVERQCAHMGDMAFAILQAKSARTFLSDPAKPDSQFLLSQLPDEATVEVDSHSSSPIYEDDHEQKAAFLLKAGAIDQMDLLDLIEVPRRDVLKANLKKRQAQEAKLFKEHPELLVEKLKHGSGGGGHK